jgi:glycosyltransferase involved in cell wall biosynthesis
MSRRLNAAPGGAGGHAGGHGPAGASAVSVVTVTWNNAAGLRQTLASLAALQHRPLEVVIVDGGSTDGTEAVVGEYAGQLALSYSSEPDEGIYEAMNKGHRRCGGALVHYLNAGDTVFGEPYAAAAQPCLLPVRVHDAEGRYFFDEFVRFGGRAYCHQGILFPVAHPDYDTKYRIAADLDLMLACFPGGLERLPKVKGGGVRFDQGGVSTRAAATQTHEFLAVFRCRLPRGEALGLYAYLQVKRFIPQALRRAIVGWRHGR